VTNQKPHVVKLGGSLLDLPDLFTRLEAFRTSDIPFQGALLVGGGRAADQVRRFGSNHNLSEDTGHWLAVRAMQFNTYLVVAGLRRIRIAIDEDDCTSAWAAGDLAVIDPLIWLENEHRRGVAIPHRWSFTSDSIGAHVATRLGASCLTLLKSSLGTDCRSVSDATRRGLVDEDFQAASATIGRVELVNLRAVPLSCCVLKRDEPRHGHGWDRSPDADRR